MSDLDKIYHYLPLTDLLLTSGQPTRRQFKDVAEAGVQTVINLAMPTSDNAIRDEPSVVESLKMDYIPIPVIWENPTHADRDKFFAAMDEQANKKILVHCAANMRVSAFVALYRILRLGWDRDKAFQDTYLIWDPFTNPVWGPFVESVLKEK